jgi:hypothetical protein
VYIGSVSDVSYENSVRSFQCKAEREAVFNPEIENDKIV